jgi:MoxR-like ATPase
VPISKLSGDDQMEKHDARSKKTLGELIQVYQAIRHGLDAHVVGYEEFKNALVLAHFKRTLGLRGHLLAFGPPGVAKTVGTKAMAALLGQANGQPLYVRTSGRSDLMPEEFLAERVADYNEFGRLIFVYQLMTIGKVKSADHALPMLWQLDETDKIPPRTLHAFLELMEEGQYTTPAGETIELNFMLMSTANTRAYDKAAQPIPVPVQDRYAAVVHNRYLDEKSDLAVLDLAINGETASSKANIPSLPNADDIRFLREQIRISGLPIEIPQVIRQGIVRCVKLTQEEVPGHTNFAQKIKVPAGPRGYLSFWQEAAALALLSGDGVVRAKHCINAGHRVFRGRIEVTADAEVSGQNADAVITDILQEVFGEIAKQDLPDPFFGDGTGAKKGEDEGDEPSAQDQSADFRAQLRRQAQEQDPKV